MHSACGKIDGSTSTRDPTMILDDEANKDVKSVNN